MSDGLRAFWFITSFFFAFVLLVLHSAYSLGSWSLVKSSRIIASSIFGIIWRISSMIVESSTQYLSYLLFLFSMNFYDFLWVLLLAITFSSSFLLNVLFSSLYLKFSDMILFPLVVSLFFSSKFSIQDLFLSHFWGSSFCLFLPLVLSYWYL